jgi:HPt (histidine-containing phosphotransfer) domain-containing protein
MPENSSEIIVPIDPDIEDLIPGFLKGRREDIAIIDDALEKGDFSRIQRLGHSLKGNGAGYGFDELTNIGRTLEAAAVSGDRDRIRQATDAMADYLSRVKVIIAAEP